MAHDMRRAQEEEAAAAAADHARWSTWLAGLRDPTHQQRIAALVASLDTADANAACAKMAACLYLFRLRRLLLAVEGTRHRSTLFVAFLHHHYGSGAEAERRDTNLHRVSKWFVLVSDEDDFYRHLCTPSSPRQSRPPAFHSFTLLNPWLEQIRAECATAGTDFHQQLQSYLGTRHLADVLRARYAAAAAAPPAPAVPPSALAISPDAQLCIAAAAASAVQTLTESLPTSSAPTSVAMDLDGDMDGALPPHCAQASEQTHVPSESAGSSTQPAGALPLFPRQRRARHAPPETDADASVEDEWLRNTVHIPAEDSPTTRKRSRSSSCSISQTMAVHTSSPTPLRRRSSRATRSCSPLARSSVRRRTAVPVVADDEDDDEDDDNAAHAEATHSRQSASHSSLLPHPSAALPRVAPEATRPIISPQPLHHCLPHDPRVAQHLSQHGVAVVEPCFADHLSLLQQLNPALLRRQAYTRAYRMSLSCINDSTSHQLTISPKQSMATAGAAAAAVTADEVFAFLEREWAHKVDRAQVGPLPYHRSTEDCVYFKDLSAAVDVRSDSSGDKSCHPLPPSFFPAWDEQLEALVEHAERTRGSPSTTGEPDDTQATADISMDDADDAATSVLQTRLAAGQYAWHPLFQNEYALHRQSLLRLSPQQIDGVHTSYAYLKFGFQFFNLHIEQLLMPFVHHQLCGESVWILVPHSERDKLDRLTQHMAVTQASWLGRQRRRQRRRPHSRSGSTRRPTATTTTTDNAMGRVLLFSKSLFPPLSLLDHHRVRYHCITLKAGQVLLAHGGFAHYGFSTSLGETHSLACNFLTPQWLTHGGLEFVIGFLEWIQQLADLQDAGCLDDQLAAVGIRTTQLANALNTCPPAYTCSLLSAVRTSLGQHVHTSTTSSSSAPSSSPSSSIVHDDPSDQFDYRSLSLDQARAAIVHLHTALALLHDARTRDFLRGRYVDESLTALLCSCSIDDHGHPPCAPSAIRHLHSYMERTWSLVSTSSDLLEHAMAGTRAQTQQRRQQEDDSIASKPATTMEVPTAVSIGYGCVTAAAWERVLEVLTSDAVQPVSLRLSRHSRFLDVGSGIGQIVLHTQLVRNLASCVGIECVRQRWAAGSETLQHLKAHRLPDQMQLLEELLPSLQDDRLERVRFVHGAIEEHRHLVADATHVFMCDLVFHPEAHRILLPLLCAGRRRVVVTCLRPDQIQSLWRRHDLGGVNSSCSSDDDDHAAPFDLLGRQPLTMAGSGQTFEAYIYATRVMCPPPEK